MLQRPETLFGVRLEELRMPLGVHLDRGRGCRWIDLRDCAQGGGTEAAQTTTATPLDPAPAPAAEPANALFIAALDGVTSTVSPLRPGAFAAAVAPFAFEALATTPGSQGGIGALAVLGLADGSVIYSGGPDRAWLYRIDDQGAGGEEPFARLDTPIYGLGLTDDGSKGGIAAATAYLGDALKE